MIILGLNAYHGDAAAAIIRDGELIAAVEEERFNRFKHCAGFPTAWIRYCLQTAGIEISDVDHIGISRDPSAHLHKKILFAAGRAAKQMAGGKSSWQEAVSTIEIGDEGVKGKMKLATTVEQGTELMVKGVGREYFVKLRTG